MNRQLLQTRVATQTTQANALHAKARWLHISLPLLMAFAVAQFSKSSIGIFAANDQFSHDFALNLHPGAVGWLSSIFLYVYGVALFGWGFVVKLFGARRSMLFGTALWFIALALTPLCHTIPELYGTRVLLGIGEACFYPVAHTLTARWFPIQERARASASWLSGIFIGSALASSLTTILLVSVGWRLAFVIQAAIALVFGFGFTLFLIQDYPSKTSGISQEELERIERDLYENTNYIPKKGPDSPFRNYRYWLTMLMYLGGNIPFYGVVTWLPSYLSQGRHVPFTEMGFILTISNGLSILVMVLVGIYSDKKVRRATSALLGFVIEGAGIVIAILFPETSIISVGILLALAGNAWCVVTNWALLHSFMPTKRAESSSGVFSSFTNIVGAGVPALMGAILAATHSYTGGFMVLVGTIVISIICCTILIPQKY
ncbi:MFS transporter [Alicyclobacillus suci]|uniref:MFS transporter n=1 Tax=Alicyclobacillus suci TaxID=2816080 RepID=UPI0016624071|nr:MFS transporter [Alicyclobacillus suci]